MTEDGGNPDVKVAPEAPAQPAWPLGLRIAKTAVQLALLALVVYYIIRALARGLGQVQWAGLHVNWLLVVLSLCVTAGGMVLVVEANRLLLAAAFGRLPWRHMAAVTWITRLGKYIPGKMASIVGAAYMLRGYGIPAMVGTSVIVLNTALTIIVGLVLSVPLVLWEPLRQRLPMAWLWALVGIGAGCVAVHPRVNIFLVNLLLRLAKRPPLSMRHTLADYGRPLVIILLQWVLSGAALWLLAASVADVSLDRLPLMVAASSLAVTAGFIVVICPAGLGVREAVYLLVLQQVMGLELASLVTVGMRLIYTLAEVTLAGVGAVMLRLGGPPTVHPAEQPGQEG